jgi:hypothetical protein
LQNEAGTSCRPDAQEALQRLEAAIVDAFDEMNRHLAHARFDFSNDIQWARSIGIATSVGVAYFLAAELSVVF